MLSIGKQVLKLCRDNIILILIAGAFGLLAASPHIRAWNIVGPEEFTGVHVQFCDDEVTYQARIKEAVEGNLGIGNPYIKEHKDDPFIMPPLAEWSVALVAFLTGQSVPFVTSVSDFVFVFVNFILLYVVFHTLTRNRFISLLYTGIFFIFSLETFGRPISPQFNILFLFTGLVAIIRVYFSKDVEKKRINLLVGLIVGSTAFIYPYYFTALLAFYVILFVIRGCIEKSLTPIRQNFPWFFVSFLPLALLYTYFQIKAAGDPTYSETILRYGLMHTHMPGSFTNLLFGAMTLAVFLVLYKKLSSQNFAFGIASIASIYALNLQNIITGKSLQFSTHYLAVTILFVFLVLALVHVILRSEEARDIPSFKKYLIVMGMFCIVAFIGHKQEHQYLVIDEMPYSRSELVHEQKKMKVFDWLNQNTEVDSVVYTLGDEYDYLLPVYTNNRVFYNFYAALYPASHEETEERWIIQNIFDPHVSTTTIEHMQREFWGNRYIDTYQSKENRKKIMSSLRGVPYTPDAMVPETQVEYMYGRYLEMKKESVYELLNRYEIDYFLVSRAYHAYDDAVRALEDMEYVTFLTEIEGVRMYRLTR
jgi:hypothetical protein